MTPKEFFNLVGLLRTAQKRYFKDRTPAALTAAKELERQVDKALAEGIADPEVLQQTRMFEDRP